MAKEKLTQISKKALVFSVFVVVLYFIFLELNYLTFPIYFNFTLNEAVILAFQIIFIFLIAKAPIGKSAKVKGFIAIGIFIFIRLISLGFSVQVENLNYNSFWFIAFFVMYVAASLIGLEGLSEVKYD